MAFTYLILNVVFIGLILVVFHRDLKRPTQTWWLSFAALLLLTLIFDSLMLSLGFFSYDTSKLLGIYIAQAPIEDFFYAILAAIVAPLLWRRFGNDKKEPIS